MKRPPAGRRRQRGGALLVIAALLLLGIAWGAMSAARNIVPPGQAEREAKTGAALEAAKRALIGYMVQQAARSDNPIPGQLPCPEALSSIGTANEGLEDTSCSTLVGRLPWQTLGLDQPRDGAAEPLWYALSPAFRTSPLNFATPGSLPYTTGGTTGNVVALIIAPGAPLDTTGVGGTPPAGCSAVSQTGTNRNQAPLNVARFLECGNESGSYQHLGVSDWTNDRVITITAAEWADAIAPAIADRLQRQVAPAMEDYRSTTSLASWGLRFLPNASTISSVVANSQPENNNLCGNVDVRAGMPPTATIASGTCSTNWTGYVSPPASDLGSLLSGLLTFGGCATVSTPAAGVRCTFTVVVSGLGFLNPRITLVAPRVGYTFRYVDPSQIQYQIGSGAWQSATTSILSGSVDSGDGTGNFIFRVQLPLGLLTTLRVFIPQPSDALLDDTRSAWWINNGWDRYTYYAVARPATHDPGFGTCNPPFGTTSSCLTVSDMGGPNDAKRLVLVFTGRQRDGTTQPSFTLSNYWEGENADSDSTYLVSAVDASFNDRVAACPYRYYAADGTTILATACN